MCTDNTNNNDIERLSAVTAEAQRLVVNEILIYVGGISVVSQTLYSIACFYQALGLWSMIHLTQAI